jgi:hypothetical protein
MNIFLLDRNPEKCARYHCDKHVIKMILESAQIMCSVLWKTGVYAPYRPTHLSHPCVIWAGESVTNWLWLKSLATALNCEYRYRFKKSNDHRSYLVILALPIPTIPDCGLTPHVQVMPETYRCTNPVRAYRHYYVHEKAKIARWTNRTMPPWFKTRSVA